MILGGVSEEISIRMTTNISGAPLALEEDSALEVPEEPEKEDDDQDDMPKDSESESSSGSLLNFLTGEHNFFIGVSLSGRGLGLITRPQSTLF